jgi:uncharacterized membrane protein
MLPGEEQMGIAGFFTLWLSIWTVGVFFLVLTAYKGWKGFISGGGSFSSALFITLFALPFVAAEIGALVAMISEISFAYPATLLAVLLINFLFYQWLKAPTLAGRRLLDKVEGFRLFLSVAEGEELNFRHPPEKTPELFEAYLPYALALDVEQEWAERFNDVVSRAGAEDYRPSWYSGRSWSHHNLGGFTSTMGGAMSSAISSSSTAPGSSSGSSGGGSSGGGGGGGGGGGW